MIYLLGSIRKIMLEGDFLSLYNEFSFKVQTLKWQRKYKEFNDYYQKRQWNEAIVAAKVILKTNNGDEKFYRNLAHTYKKIKKMDEATIAMREAFMLKSTVKKQTLIRKIESASFVNPSRVSSQFVYLGGADNIGFIRHIEVSGTETKKYLTKVIPTDYPLDHFAYKESYLHTKVLKDYPELRHIVPEMVYCMESKQDQLLFLTFQKIANCGINKSNLPEIIQLQKEIANSISYEEVVNILKVTDKGKARQLSATMHQRSTHRLYFRKMKNKINTLADNKELKKIIKQVERVILDQKLYKKIKPAEDYIFSHRDFNAENILYNKEEARYYVLDWSSYGLGLKGSDAAKLLASYDLAFTEIEERYLAEVFENVTIVDCIFFAYQLIIEWIKKLTGTNMKQQVSQCILPAAQYIEKQNTQV